MVVFKLLLPYRIYIMADLYVVYLWFIGSEVIDLCRLTVFGCVIFLVVESGCVDAGMVLISCTILLDGVTYSLYMRCVYVSLDIVALCVGP